MSDYINENANYFHGFDFDHAKPIKHPLIAKAQDTAKNIQKHDDLTCFFDDDVQKTIKQHNNPQDRFRLNQMIRLLFATA